MNRCQRLWEFIVKPQNWLSLKRPLGLQPHTSPDFLCPDTVTCHRKRLDSIFRKKKIWSRVLPPCLLSSPAFPLLTLSLQPVPSFLVKFPLWFLLLPEACLSSASQQKLGEGRYLVWLSLEWHPGGAYGHLLNKEFRLLPAQVNRHSPGKEYILGASDDMDCDCGLANTEGDGSCHQDD